MAWFETSTVLACANTILLVLASVIILWWWGIRERGLPPGPTGVPVLGYLPFLGKSIPKGLAHLAEKYGPIYSLDLGGKQCVVLNRYDVLHKALVKTANVFSGRSTSKILRDLGSTNGIAFRDYGKTWTKMKKFIISTFNRLGMGKRIMDDRVNEEVQYLLEEIRSKRGETINVQEMLLAAVCNIIYSIVTGKRSEYEDEKFKRFLDLMSERYTGTATATKLKFIKRFPQLKHMPGFKSAYKNLAEQINYTSAMLDGIVEEHRETLDPEYTRDFIDAFLKEMDRDDENHFTKKTMYPLIRDLFVGGTESTATTLRWCILYLASNLDFQDRLRQGIHSAIGDAVLSMDKRDIMPLMRSFVHEIQRTKPIFPLIPRKTTEAIVFEGYKLPKNTEVILNIWQVHRDLESFTDPSKFWPERFLDSEGRFNKHDGVIPYSIGPRYCLGQRLADMEIFMFLTEMLRNFRIVEDPKYPLPSFKEGVDGLVYSPMPYRARFVPISY